MGVKESTLGNALIRACELGQLHKVNELLEEGAAINFHNSVRAKVCAVMTSQLCHCAAPLRRLVTRLCLLPSSSVRMRCLTACCLCQALISTCLTW